MIDKLHYISQQSEQGTHVSNIKNVLEAGCKWVQLRVKNETEKYILETAIEVKEVCNYYGARLIINDYPEIAVQAGAYGIHLGLEDMPVKEARKIVGKKMIIGGTANTSEQVLQRVSEGCDYIGLGPFRFTVTKEKISPVLGLRGYSLIMETLNLENIKVPVIAIGGILPDDISALRKTGVYGVAISSSLTRAANLSQVVKSIYGQINEC